jgi:DNA helicase-2/ATP-dependent DNA helicase PcrA
LGVANAVLPTAQKLVANKKSVGIAPIFTAFSKPEEEARFICNEIKRLHNEGKKLSDIAILFRSSPAISEVFEALVNEQIPVVKIGSDCTKWFNSRFRKIIALMNFAYGTSNIHYLKCVLPIFNIPQNALTETYFENSPSIKDVLLNFPALSKAQKAKLQQFFSIDVSKVTMQELSKQLWDLILKEHYGATDDRVIEEFCEAISRFETFADLRFYLSKIRLISKQMERLANDPTADYVRLLSIHTSKGMEFDTVFLVGASDGILPDTTHETANIAEENRLAYVAVTRAKERLYVTYTSSNNGKNVEASRFFSQQFQNV